MEDSRTDQRMNIGKQRFYVLQEICNLGVKEFENELSQYSREDNFTEVVRVQQKQYTLKGIIDRLEQLKSDMKWI